MNRQRLGCLTGTGILATAVTLMAIVAFLFLQGNAMFSPGALNAQPGEMLGSVTSHAQAECKACHTAPWELARMADRCATCHTDIAAQMLTVSSLHGSITHRNPDLSCSHCHPDHRGPDASLTIASLADFPHGELGFSLNGHQHKVTREAFVCEDCHTQEISKFDAVVCADCHRQMNEAFLTPHLAAWGADCLGCHDGVDSYGDDFDHNRYPFQLAGKHAQVACYDCHANARSLVDLRNQPRDCTSCHPKDDAHQGRFGTDCGSCHSSDGWKPAKFDHSKSNFPLTGAHVSVACEQCHINNQFVGTPTACVNCHEDPAFHLGQFGTNCAACHSTTAWRPAQFTGRHTFPLNHGEGGQVSCVTCHPTNFATYTCYGCHEHNELEIRAKHLEEGISNFENCMECHPTGEEHEGGDD